MAWGRPTLAWGHAGAVAWGRPTLAWGQIFSTHSYFQPPARHTRARRHAYRRPAQIYGHTSMWGCVSIGGSVRNRFTRSKAANIGGQSVAAMQAPGWGGGSAAGVGQRAPVCLVAGFVPASSTDSPPCSPRVVRRLEKTCVSSTTARDVSHRRTDHYSRAHVWEAGWTAGSQI